MNYKPRWPFPDLMFFSIQQPERDRDTHTLLLTHVFTTSPQSFESGITVILVDAFMLCFQPSFSRRSHRSWRTLPKNGNGIHGGVKLRQFESNTSLPLLHNILYPSKRSALLSALCYALIQLALDVKLSASWRRN